jgi:hypothetical protein
MTEQPKVTMDATRPSDSRTPSSGSPAASPAPSSTMSDPVHHEFGDRTEEDAGEGHKGPRTEETKVPSEPRAPEAV